MSEIEVAVETRYVERESNPGEARYVFAYTITLTNAAGAAAQLLNRHWWITDGSGQVREVQGAGVIGQQPRILPGGQFRYTSAAVMPTPFGTMHGAYEFQWDDGVRFGVRIPAFALVLPSMVH